MSALPASMPAEWEPHERTYMAWPSSGYTLGDTDGQVQEARRCWASVAAAVAVYEPVTLVAEPGAVQIAEEYVAAAGAPAGSVQLVTAALDDAWMRDIGPTFVRGSAGQLAAVDWVFNGWGAQAWATWGKDALVAGRVAGWAGVQAVPSPLVNEGGGIHVDGEGTVLVTDTVQLDPGRNPGWTREQVEEELARTIGAEQVIWLPRGLHRDYEQFGTRGHVDMIACFARPGVVLVHAQRNPAHPDHALSQELVELLAATTDARGRRLQVIEVPAPDVLEDAEGFVDHSYINHYLVNGAVILGAFEDPGDARAAAVIGAQHPARHVELVDARPLFARGGGIHCITQQQPLA